MKLMAFAQAGLNMGDIVYQLIMFVALIFIPVVVILVIFFYRKRNNTLKRIEEKLDKLISEQKNGKS